MQLRPLLLCCTALSLTTAAYAAKPDSKALMERVRKTLNASGSSIDACNTRYLSEYPKAQGKADVSVFVGPKGKVTKASIKTSLEGARNLRYCLEQVAKGWTLPKEYAGPKPMNLSVPIQAGVKFKILAPGEKPPPGQPPQARTVIKFTGKKFTPGWNQ